jgi:STE24 endopeptidase
MNPYLIIVILLLIADWIKHVVIETLNLRAATPQPPEDLADIYEPERYAKSQHYLRTNTHFDLLQSSLMLVLLLTFILSGGFAWLHQTASAVSENIIIQGLLFTGMLVMIMKIVSIPFSLYDTFVIEARYGFNRTTQKTFIVDLIKGLLLTAILGGLILALVLWIFETVPLAWFWAWCTLSIIQLIILYIAPVAILPLFNKFTPLEEGELRDAIEAYAREQQYNLSGIFKIDGSRRSSKSNAYFTGFGKTKRIALFDTLIDQHTTDELVAILAHEAGHNRLGHITKGIAISLLTSLLMFALLAIAIVQPGLYAAFGLTETPVYAGLVFFGFLYSPISMLLGIAGNWISRRHEYQADAFAAKTTAGSNALISALKKLTSHNMGNLTPHPLKVFVEYSHPPLRERINALRRGDSLNVSD